MFMPDDDDIPQDDLEDLIDLEYEAEMDLMRELEQEAAEAALRNYEAEADKILQKEDRPPPPPSSTQTQSQRRDKDHLDVRSPSAKRAKIVDSSQSSIPSQNPTKTVLEDISNFRNENRSRDNLDISTTKIHIPLLGERKVYRRIPENSDYLSITSLEGNRFYVRLKDESSSGELNMEDSVRFGRSSTGLCGVPYMDLLEQASLQSSISLQASIDLDSESGYDSSAQEDSGSEDIASLWVEKFRPRSYLQLLSDDGTNRTLLRWLKLWDRLVFGTEKKVAKAPKPEVESADGKKFGPDGKKLTGPVNTEIIEEVDESGRPKQKVALLYGPPGLGKTTLAHVVAKHAGYNVVEMNASDDRSMEAFKNKLEAATQMKSVSEKDKRPNCLIIDEIDGAPAPTVQFLVGLITGTGSSKTVAKKKQNQPKAQMQRPIICICNDLYAPSLRTLRQHALIIQFPPTLSQRLAQRLLDISGRENLRTDLTALLALCEKTGDDIRACLSTLQFFKSRGQRLKLSDVHKSHVGQKDVQKSHFTVWDEIFRIPRTSKRRIDEEEVNVSSPGARFWNVLHTVQACGDYDRLQQGVFENYLNIKFKDSRMENVSLGQDWFCFFDLTNQQILHTQNYSLMAYLAYSFVTTHFLFSTIQKSRISYPSTATEKRNAQQKSENTIDTLLSEMTPTARVYNPVSMLIRDTLPFILTIIQPNLRPVNTHLYSQREKAELQNLVNLLVHFNLNYVQERTFEGTYIYRLEPCVEDVVYFPELNHPTVPYAIKQMISHEVEIEIMRRKEGPIPNPATSLPEIASKDLPANDQKKKAGEDQMRSIEELTKKLQAKDIQVKERIPVDFFGRPIVKSRSEQVVTIQSESDGILSSDVWFKFKEGYNNAVRRNIRVQDLF